MAILILFNVSSWSQSFSGVVVDLDGHPLRQAELSTDDGLLTISDTNGVYRFESTSSSVFIQVWSEGYRIHQMELYANKYDTIRMITPIVFTSPLIEFSVQRKKPMIASSTIPTQELEQTVSPSVYGLFEKRPGIWMQSGALNTNRISIRGVGNREPFATSKLKVYLDEIPLTSGVGESSIEDIDLLLLKNIQLWRSSSSAIWGAGIGGMIAMQSNRSPDHNIQASLQFGSFGLFRGHLALSIPRKTARKTQLGLYAIRSDGYRDNNEYEKWSGTLMHSLVDKPNFTLDLFSHLIFLKAFIPSSLGITDFTTNPTKAAFTWDNVNGNEEYSKGIHGLNYRYDVGKNWSTKGSLFLTHYASDEIRPFNILDENTLSFGLRNRWIYAPNTDLTWSFGFEHFRENYNWSTFEVAEDISRGNQLSNNEETRHYSFIFSQVDFSITPQWKILTALSMNRTALQYDLLTTNESLKKTYNWNINPSLQFTYQLSEYDDLQFGISRGFSPLSLTSILNSTGEINPDIHPESGWTLDGRWLVQSKNRRSNFSAGIYQLWLDNLVVLNRIGDDQFEAINGGRTNHFGIEIEYELAFNPWLSLQGSYGYSNHKFKEFADNGISYSGNALTGTSPHMTHNQLTVQIPKIGAFSIRHRFVDATPIRDDNTVYGEAYQIIGLTINREFMLDNHWDLRIIGSIDNLLNSSYASMFLINATAFGNSEPRYYYPGLPRNYSIRLLLTKH